MRLRGVVFPNPVDVDGFELVLDRDGDVWAVYFHDLKRSIEKRVRFVSDFSREQDEIIF